MPSLKRKKSQRRGTDPPKKKEKGKKENPPPPPQIDFLACLSKNSSKTRSKWKERSLSRLELFGSSSS